MIGIIGAGVSGLSCGILLQQAGLPVTIWTREPTLRTTSAVAAAIWHPFQAFPPERVDAWSATTYRYLVELLDDPGSGIVRQTGHEYFPYPTEDPPWRDVVGRFRRLTPAELPVAAVDGFEYETLVIETPTYLKYLVARFEANGGAIVARTLHSLDEALADTPIVVNCSGLGARELAGDASMFPIRGQIMRLAPLPDAGFRLDDHEPRPITYIVPRSDGVICGGTIGVDDWNTTADPGIADRIHTDCVALLPELSGLPILEHKVGLRPGRPAIRLEAEQRAAGVVVHNYGHGGSGYTVSWGCAEDVLHLVRSSVS